VAVEQVGLVDRLFEDAHAGILVGGRAPDKSA
jgi:hypothetical protein